MHSSSPCPPRCHTALGSLLAVGLIVIISDITLAAGIARDVISALGQHLVILGTIRGTRSARMLDDERPRCQDPRSARVHSRCDDFPALKNNTAMRSVASGRIIIY
jgi:hypothetical protein